MLVITLADYWMGRDHTYEKDMTAEIRGNATDLLRRVNALLTQFRVETGDVEIRQVNSGWRPAAYNASVPGAARRSHHITGRAIDIDDDDGALDDWCFEHLPTLGSLGLWMEHPAATKGWCHLQTLPPRSGKRVFYP